MEPETITIIRNQGGTDGHINLEKEEVRVIIKASLCQGRR